jgi:Protein of unknown function (DUF3551)
MQRVLDSLNVLNTIDRGACRAREAFMRTIALVAVTFAALSLATTGARADGTWCAQYGGSNGGRNCGFHSLAQCEAARWGNGGFCSPNPFSAYGTTREPRRRHRPDR